MVVGGFHVENHAGCPSGNVVINPFFGIVDHQMHVKRLIGDLMHIGGDPRAKGQIRNKMPIHDVDVNPVCVVDFLDVVTQVGKVGGQNGWGDDRRLCHGPIIDRRATTTGGYDTGRRSTAKNIASVP